MILPGEVDGILDGSLPLSYVISSCQNYVLGGFHVNVPPEVRGPFCQWFESSRPLHDQVAAAVHPQQQLRI